MHSVTAAPEDLSGVHHGSNVIQAEFIIKDHLELERLPKEIRFQIFDILIQSIGEVKLVCKSWQQMVSEWNTPENRPEFLMIDLNEESKQTISVSVELRNSARTCLLDFWQFAKEASRKSEDPCIEKFPEFTRISLILPYAKPELLERLSKVISPKTRTLWVQRWAEYFDGSPYVEQIRLLLRPLKRADTVFAALRYMTDQPYVQLLTHLSSQCRIPKMVCSFDSGAVTNLQDFLTSLSSNIPSIQLTQHNMFSRNRTFFGDEKVDWVRLITEMFESGVRDLNMQNTIPFSNDGFMSVDDLRRLAKSLATIRRSIKFTTNVGKELKMDFDDPRIQVKNVTKLQNGQEVPNLVVITIMDDQNTSSS